MKVEALADATDLLTETAQLIADVWPAYYGPDCPGDAYATVLQRARKGGLPFGIVMRDHGGRPVGTAALDAQSFGAAAHEGPWLVGLAVAASERQKGIGTQLIAALEDIGARRQHKMLYVTTTHATLFRARGWQDFRQIEDADQTWFVLSKVL